MIVGVKFGVRDQEYFIDFEISRLYTEVNDKVVSLEGKNEEESYKLQEEILTVREAIEEFKEYIIENDRYEKYNPLIIELGIRVDNSQQIVLNRVIEAINKAKEVNNVEAINKAKLSIPENMPDIWKVNFEKEINNIGI